MNRRRLLVIVILAVGGALRLRHYLANRSLWLDECFLALNIRDRGFLGLLQPLEYDQAAPIGFLMAAKAATLFFGESEYALRLVPLLAGLAALSMFWFLAHGVLSRGGAILATGLFALSEFPVYYSSEVKQYSIDVLATLVMLIAARRVLRSPAGATRPKDWGVLTAVGAALIWCSHPMVFVLPGILIGLAVGEAHPRRLLFRWLCLPAVVWGASFLANYLVSLRHFSGSAHLHFYWRGAFLPVPPRSLADLRGTAEALLRFFQDPMGLTLLGISAFCTALGAAMLWKRNRPLALMLQVPAWLALAASSLERYPFQGRLVLFLVPPAMLLLAAGADEIRALLWDRFRGGAFFLLALLVFHPLVHAYDYVRHPRLREELRPVLAHLASRWTRDDMIYVGGRSRWGYAYYAPRIGLVGAPHVIGMLPHGDPELIRAELQALEGRRRVWCVVSHFGAAVDGEIDHGTYLTYLHELGRELYRIEEFGASAFLFDLSEGETG